MSIMRLHCLIYFCQTTFEISVTFLKYCKQLIGSDALLLEIINLTLGTFVRIEFAQFFVAAWPRRFELCQVHGCLRCRLCGLSQLMCEFAVFIFGRNQIFMPWHAWCLDFINLFFKLALRQRNVQLILLK